MVRKPVTVTALNIENVVFNIAREQLSHSFQIDLVQLLPSKLPIIVLINKFKGLKDNG